MLIRCSPVVAGLLAVGLLVPQRPIDADDDRNTAVLAAVRAFARPGHIELPIGVTPRGTLIWCLVHPEALLPAENVTRVVIVAGLDGDPAVVDALREHRDGPLLGADDLGRRLRAWIPIARPEVWSDCVRHGAAPQPLVFPPQGPAYSGPGAEALVLNRFAEWFAPDMIVEITPESDVNYERTLAKQRVDRGASGYAVLASRGQPASRLSTYAEWIPAHRLGATWESLAPLTQRYIRPLAFEPEMAPHPPTVAAALARLQRPPLEVARRLLDHYGHKLNPVMYQPALALIARLHYGRLTHDDAQRQAVEGLLQPYLSGARAPLDEQSSGSHFAGQLVFAAWASHPAMKADPKAIEFVRAAADRAFLPDGRPREAMPAHNEMSDAVFMACPILTAAGRLTRQPKYFDMAGRHLAFMQGHCLRDDGLYRHSPLCEAAWGRGNGFPALGLALSLTELESLLANPKFAGDEPLLASAERLHGQMLTSLRRHAAALLPHQDPTGMWRQVIDHPGAYRELTATCMITVALARGVRLGWLDAATYRPAIDRAWNALQLRIFDDGVLLDVCTGTGKQPSLQDYFNREAILGVDERGGAMALLAALELAELQALPP